MTARGIVILEGADSSGKTTLANVFRERHGARYLHGRVFPDPWKYHLAMLRRATRLADTQLVVVDRHWLSHLAYGRAFDNGTYDVAGRSFDRAWRRAGALTILCVPGDPRRQEADWAIDRTAGKVEHFDRVRGVINLYIDLARGNVAHPGNGYLDQLIRFQDFAERDDVLVYDRYGWEGNARMARFAAGALRYLSMLRLRAYAPGLDSARWNLTGRADVARPGAILFVGEALSPRVLAVTPRRLPLPMLQRETDAGAATWFNAAVHRLALREDRIVVTNALEADDHIGTLLAEARPLASYKVVALGEKAAERLTELGVTNYRGTAHPRWHRRFRFSEGPEGYARLLREALR
jgi:hypothetical protein